MAKTVAVLAVQGAFIEHEAILTRLGARTVELRRGEDLRQGFDALVLPGGESTVQGKLLREEGMLDVLRALIAGGMPVLGTCAGLILLARHIERGFAHGGGDGNLHGRVHLATLPVTVRRNAYGRQLGSFRVIAPYGGAGELSMTFIRAPRIMAVDAGVDVLARVDGMPVAVRSGNQLACAFHPELGGSTLVHEQLLGMI